MGEIEIVRLAARGSRLAVRGYLAAGGVAFEGF
jgi:hypothetical protein